MKKILAVALVSIGVWSLAAGQASAWPMRHCWCCNKCCRVSCSQYNAFSAFCCDGCVCGPQRDNNGYYPPVCAYYGDNGHGNLPAGPANGNGGNAGPVGYGPMPAYAGPVSGPTYGVPTYANAPAAPSYNPPAFQPGYNPMPSYGNPVARPTGVPSYYPSSMGYAPAYSGVR
jgi:hypothetical protein